MTKRIITSTIVSMLIAAASSVMAAEATKPLVAVERPNPVVNKTPVKLSPLPDLVVTSLTTNLNNLLQDGNMAILTTSRTLEVVVANRGGADVVTPFTLKVYCEPLPGSGPNGTTPSCPELFNDLKLTYPGLKKDTSHLTKIYHDHAGLWHTGTYQVYAGVDDTKRIHESNEENNTSVRLLVKVTPK